MAHQVDNSIIQFDGFRKPDEPVAAWLQRVLAQPFEGPDRATVQNKVDDIEKIRDERNHREYLAGNLSI